VSRLSLEPPDPDLHLGSAPVPGIARLAAFGAAAAVLLASTGDGLVAAVLLGLLAADALAGTVAAAAVLGGLARFGTTSLAGLAGAQAVLGPAVSVAPALGAAASGLAAVSVLAAAPPGWRGWPFGLLAGLIACGPAATSPADGLVRLAGVVGGVALAVLVPRPAWVRWPALGLSLAALVLAVSA
jgi:hypothetical protein